MHSPVPPAPAGVQGQDPAAAAQGGAGPRGSRGCAGYTSQLGTAWWQQFPVQENQPAHYSTPANLPAHPAGSGFGCHNHLPPGPPAAPPIAAGMLGWYDLQWAGEGRRLQGELLRRQRDLRPGEPANIQFTSGVRRRLSTGRRLLSLSLSTAAQLHPPVHLFLLLWRPLLPLPIPCCCRHHWLPKGRHPVAPQHPQQRIAGGRRLPLH